MSAIGYFGLQWLCISLVWGLPENQTFALFSALVASFMFSACGFVKLFRDNELI